MYKANKAKAIIAVFLLLAQTGCIPPGLGPRDSAPQSIERQALRVNSDTQREEVGEAKAITARSIEASAIDFLGVGRIASDTSDTAAGEGAGEGAANGLRVAVILPLSARGSVGALAQSMRRSAEMALFDFRASDVALVFLDSMGTRQGARIAARRAVEVGADVVIGPLLSSNVHAVWQEVNPYDITILAFSSDAAVAGNGVLLISVTPEQSINQVIDFAVQRGLLRFAALIPETPYGNVAEQALVNSALNTGSTVVQIARYKPNSRDGIAAAERLAKWVRARHVDVDAIFLPDAPAMIKTLAPVFPYHGIDTNSTRLLGSGLWKGTDLSSETALIGAWYAAPTDIAYERFARRYAARFKQRPPRLAAMAYDGVSLIARFANRGVIPTAEGLSDRSGYFGIDGLFRFGEDGSTERSLDVLQVAPSGRDLVKQGLLTFERSDGGDSRSP